LCVSGAQIKIIIKFVLGSVRMVSVPLAEGSILDSYYEVLKSPHEYLQGASKCHVVGSGSRAFICSTVYRVLTGPVLSPWLAILF
jgi:hypothetical protein